MKLLNFPFYRQANEYYCGPTVICALLAYYGKDVRIDEIAKLVYVSKERGASMSNMVPALRSYQLEVTAGEMDLATIKSHIDRAIPPILALQAWPVDKTPGWEDGWSSGHYVVAIGYDDDQIYFADPANAAPTYLSYADLERRWHDIDSGPGPEFSQANVKQYQKFAIIATAKEGPRWPLPPEKME